VIEINLEEIPRSPGVYLFKGERGEVLYVGKAKDLRARLSSYPRAAALHPKIAKLLEKATSLEFILTRTEKEALLLEANLIKKYRPKYNVVLKDDKNYPLLRLSLQEEYPALQIVRKRKKGDKAIYFGPFTSARGLREILKLISSLFPLRKCSLAEMKRRQTPCVYYQIKKCLAPCVRKIPKEEYDKLVKGVLEFFHGGGRELVEKLRREMEEAAERLEFERAAFLRDRIKDLELILERQAVVLDEQIDLDFWQVLEDKENFYAGVLFIRYGHLYGFQGFKLKSLFKEEELESAILQFYSQGKPIPEYICLPSGFASKKNLKEALSELAEKEVKLISHGEKESLKILQGIAFKNLRKLSESEDVEGDVWNERLVEELMTVFRLKKEPRWIEAIDLSQYYGEARVGGLVCFFEGVPEKSRYRKYHIKEAEAKDDYAMLYEVVLRRLRRGLEEDNLPDLVLIDGGKGHLQTALRAAEDLGISTKVDFVAVAKNEKRLPEKAYLPERKNPVFLKRHSKIYNFVGRIMSEAHRFAKGFAEDTKSKKNLEDFLTDIKGIGEKRRKVLLERFKSLEEIKEATLAELSSLPGFNLKVAKALKDALNS